MPTYSTWVYYETEYQGQLDMPEYGRLAPAAKHEIDWMTQGKAEDARAAMADQLARCECEMVDMLATSQSLGMAPGVSGVSNDGYSVSFAVGAREACEKERTRIGRKYLTRPVNLLFSGAVVKNVCS